MIDEVVDKIRLLELENKSVNLLLVPGSLFIALCMRPDFSHATPDVGFLALDGKRIRVKSINTKEVIYAYEF